MAQPVGNVRSRGTDRRLAHESSESEVSRLPLPEKPSRLRYTTDIDVILRELQATEESTKAVTSTQDPSPRVPRLRMTNPSQLIGLYW